jgi:hypothetical protein
MKESGVLLNIDVCFKVVRTDTCLALLKDLTDKAAGKGQNPQEAV